MDVTNKREIIMAHYLKPINKENPNNENYIKINSRNENCIDNIDLYILFDNDFIKDLKFTGEACVIATSASSIMIKNLIGKSIKEALEYIEAYEKMIDGKVYNSKLLEEANVYNDIHEQESRKNCVLLPSSGLKKVLEEQLKK